MEIERDFINSLLDVLGSPISGSLLVSGSRSLPINPFRAIGPTDSEWRMGKAGIAERMVPGEVGGRAIGTELMECALRLCECVAECEAERGGTASGLRVLVKVIVTENGSPAK